MSISRTSDSPNPTARQCHLRLMSASEPTDFSTFSAADLLARICEFAPRSVYMTVCEDHEVAED